MAKSRMKRPGSKKMLRRLVSLPASDGLHYTPLASGKWLRSRRSSAGWKHVLIAKPAISASGSAGPNLTSTICPIDGHDYIKLSNGNYLRSIRNPDGTWRQDEVRERQVPPACRRT